jgi:hypothetical protein
MAFSVMPKKSVVKPILKKGTTDDVDNYYPITSVPVTSMILENNCKTAGIIP